MAGSLALGAAAFAADFTGLVVSDLDGDTIEVLRNGKAERVRLHGIDFPEKGQEFGQRAKKETSALAFGLNVTVHPTDTDKYGRTVAMVVLPNGKTLNHELVKGGWCWWYRKYAPNDTDLEQLEIDASSRPVPRILNPR